MEKVSTVAAATKRAADGDARGAVGAAAAKKRKLRKGAKKSKAERLARVSASAAAISTSQRRAEDAESLDALRVLLDDPQSASSKEWDVAQSLALRIGSLEAKELVVHKVLWRKVAPKAAAHYAKRLQLTEASAVRILSNAADEPAAGDGDAGTAGAHDGASNLLRAKFLCDVSTATVSNAQRLDTFLWPWLVAQAKVKSASDSNAGQDDASDAARVAMNHAMQAHGAAIRLLLVPQHQPQANSSKKKRSHGDSEREELQRMLVEKCIAEGEFLHFVPTHASAFRSSVSQAMVQASTSAADEGALDDSTSDAFAPDALDAPAVQAEQTRRQEVAKRIESVLQLMWADAEVVVFGSSATGLLRCDPATQQCSDDLDLCVLIPSAPVFRQATAPLVAEMREHLSVYLSGCSDLLAIEGARIPIVQFTDPASGLRCDVCVNNVTALWNTQLMRRLLNESNPAWSARIRALSLWLKQWRSAKRRLFGSGLSSYGLQLLVVYYFQQRKVLPAVSLATDGSVETQESLQSFNGDAVRKLIEAVEAPLPSSTAQPCGEGERMSSWSVLIDFFRFYAIEFNYEDTVVSLRGVEIVSKTSKQWTRKAWKSVLSIEDPIETDRDLGSLFNRKTFARLRTAFVHACAIFSKMSLRRSEQIEALLACMPYDLVQPTESVPASASRKDSMESESLSE